MKLFTRQPNRCIFLKVLKKLKVGDNLEYFIQIELVRLL